MQYSTFLAATFFSIASVIAADAQEVAFVTKLVSDAKAHESDYLNYYATGTVDVPPEFLKLAKQVQTYTDDSYTTLIDSESINVPQLESFASQLPWASRLEVAPETTSAAPEASPTEAASSPAAAAATSADVAPSSAAPIAPASSAPASSAPAPSAPAVSASSTQYVSSWATSTSTYCPESLAASNSSVAVYEGAAGKVAPYGVAFGALVVALI